MEANTIETRLISKEVIEDMEARIIETSPSTKELCISMGNINSKTAELVRRFEIQR
jgi:hypothetical protein